MPSILDLASFLVGVAGMACAITIMFLAMRAVMEVGGSCADGGPYVSAQSCPDGTVPAMLLGIFGGLGAAGLVALKGSALGPGFGSVALLGWTGLFCALGYNFLAYGFGPGGDITMVLVGVMFEVMGIVPAIGVAGSIVNSFLGRAPSKGSPVRPTSFVAPVAEPRLRMPVIQFTSNDEAGRRAAMARLDGVLRAELADRAVHELPSAPTGGAAASPAPDPEAELAGLVSSLERLTTLHSSGALTDDEFAAAKADLLKAANQ